MEAVGVTDYTRQTPPKCCRRKNCPKPEDLKVLKRSSEIGSQDLYNVKLRQSQPRLIYLIKIFFTDRSKAVRLLWIIHVISVVCLLFFRACLFIVALWSPAGKGLTSWLSFMMSNCEFVTFPLVSWVGCGT